MGACEVIAVDPIRAGIAAGVLAVVALVGYQSWRIRDLKQQRAVLEAREDTWRQAQSTNLNTIRELREALQRIADERRIDERKAREAVAAAQSEAENIQKRLDAARGELDNVYAKFPRARAWGAVGVDADVARRLPGGADRQN